MDTISRHHMYLVPLLWYLPQTVSTHFKGQLHT